MNWWEETAENHVSTINAPPPPAVRDAHVTPEQFRRIKLTRNTQLCSLAKELGMTLERLIEIRWNNGKHQ